MPMVPSRQSVTRRICVTCYGKNEIILGWGKENLPRGLAAFKSLGGFEIAFRACLPQLQRDPAWKSAEERRKEFEQEYALIPAAEARRRYLTEPAFKKKVDSMHVGVRQQGAWQ